MRFDELKPAIEYLRTRGPPENDMRIFRKTFKQLPEFTPNPSAPFKDEFDRFASSHGLGNHEKRKARKPVHQSLDASLVELKQCPFVNVLDFIDTYRMGQQVRTFDDWERFVFLHLG
jgi:hypothetical protein